MIISSGGQVIRTPVDGISRQGRSAQGVHVMNLREEDRVASIASTDTNGRKEETGAAEPESDGAAEDAPEGMPAEQEEVSAESEDGAVASTESEE